MKAPFHAAYSGTLTITISTPRARVAPSMKFTAASVHEDFTAAVRVAMREYKHCGPTSEFQPATLRIQNYFPTHEGRPIYALRELSPDGSARSLVPEFMLEVMTVRYRFFLVLLPAALIADPQIVEAYERNIEYAVRKFFLASNIPDEFIPGDETLRPGDRSDISILCDLGASDGRITVELPGNG